MPLQVNSIRSDLHGMGDSLKEVILMCAKLHTEMREVKAENKLLKDSIKQLQQAKSDGTTNDQWKLAREPTAKPKLRPAKDNTHNKINASWEVANGDTWGFNSKKH